MSSLRPARVAVAALLLVCAERPGAAAPGDGATLTPDGRTYLVSRDVAGERWTVGLGLSAPDGASFLHVTGNVLQPSGDAAFVFCQVRPDSTGTLLDPRSTFRLTCFGADPCATTASACSRTSWVPIDDDVAVPASFFLPPGGATDAPEGASRESAPAAAAGDGAARGATLTLDGLAFLVSKDLGGERWTISLNLVPVIAPDGGVVNEIASVTGNVHAAGGDGPAFVFCTETPESAGDLADPASVFALRCRGADACATTAVQCSTEWREIPGVIRLPAAFFLPPLGLPATASSDPEAGVVARPGDPPAVTTVDFTAPGGSAGCASGAPCSAVRIGTCSGVPGRLVQLPSGGCACRVDDVPPACIACAGVAEPCGTACAYPVGERGATARGLCLPFSALSVGCLCWAVPAGADAPEVSGCGGTLGVACAGPRCCADDPRDGCTPAGPTDPEGLACPGLCVAASGCAPDESCGACFAVPPPCADDVDCSSDQRCRWRVGACTGPGTCLPRPALCTPEVAPVCGCDAQTYESACAASAAPVSLAALGECPPGTCATTPDCAGDEACVRSEGRCAAPGQCVRRPDACPDVFAPVCGCDGSTYPNECEAIRAGTSPARPGACAAGTCARAENCGRGELCSRPVGRCDAPGECRARPGDCPPVDAPVCGCDGATYPSACAAAARGVSVAATGPCEPCRSSEECAPEQLCERPDGACAAVGRCAPRPLACPDRLAPVCGCDGLTYRSRCEAALARAAIAADRPCGPPCASDDACVSGETCARPPGSCFAAGVCVLPPASCPPDLAPVCGCDGVDYPNACLAAAAGVSVAFTGECAHAPFGDAHSWMRTIVDWLPVASSVPSSAHRWIMPWP